jgi:peptide/nickel transport system substrate-binding protein
VGGGEPVTLSHSIPPLSRRNLLKLGTAAAVAGTIVSRTRESRADGDPPPVKARQPDRGGTFRIRIPQAPAHFDPHLTAAYSTMVPLSFAYSRLVMIKPGSTIVPGTQPLDSDLAESWDRVGDTVYIFRLRRNVRWQPKPPVNGRELTAEDVKYTYDRFLATKGNPNRSVLDVVDKVEAPDKYTVKFTLKEPNAWFYDRLASTSTWIVARECVEKYGDLKKWESVVGTGPWMLDRYEPGSKLTFVRNPNCFYPNIPYVDSVELSIIPDPNAALAAFLAGKLDFGPEYGMTLRRGDIAAAKKRLGHWWLPLQTREFLMPSGRITAMKLDQDPLKDVRVRRAIAMADNWHQILERNPLAQGKGTPGPIIPAALRDWSLSIKELPPDGQKLYEPSDPAAARQLLTAAGYSSGIKIPVETTAGYGPDWMDAVQATVKNWKAAGIDAELKVQDYDAFVSGSVYGKFDKMMLGVRNAATDPDSYLETLMPGDSLNSSGVNDPKLTEMIKHQRRTFKDSARRDIVNDIQRYCSQQVYYVCGPSPSVVAAWTPNVIDFGPNIGPDYGGRLMSAWIDRQVQ